MANSSKSKSWRDVLPIHPAAELFPRMSESELRELGEDIKANGLQASIVLHKGKLLDGRNRLDAIELVGIKFGFVARGGIYRYLKSDDPALTSQCSQAALLIDRFDGDPYAFVLSANIYRRHLTTEQKRELIAKLIKQTPNKSDRQIAKQTKASPTWVGKIRKEAEAAGDVSTVDTRIDTQGRKQPSAKPKKSGKKAKAGEPSDVVDFVVGELTEAPTTPIPTKSQHGSVSARDIALEDFTARAMELVRLTRNQSARRFAKTALPDDGIRQLAKLFSDLINIRNEKVVDRICGSGEVSTEQRGAEHAALDKAAP